MARRRYHVLINGKLATTKYTPAVIHEVQRLFAAGKSVTEVWELTRVPYFSLRHVQAMDLAPEESSAWVAVYGQDL